MMFPPMAEESPLRLEAGGWVARVAGAIAARLRYIIGVERALALMLWLMFRLTRWRIAPHGEWQRGWPRDCCASPWPRRRRR